MAETEFDIIVYGATGYTGRLVAEYLSNHYGSADNAPKWAMAGRSQEKLEAVRDEIGAPADTPLVVANADDVVDLEKMCARTKVVLTTVGPYQLYGDKLVAACVKTGTDYADLCGEPAWMAEKIEQHQAKATETGARICFSSGFDSIPSDLGVHFLQSRATEKFGEMCDKVDMRVVKMKGGASGGTIASMINMVKEASADAELRRELKDPYSLCPPDHGFTARQRDVGMEYDEGFGQWIAPFVMAAINTRVVHRSNALANKAYGEDFLYEEATATGEGTKGKRGARAMSWGMGGLMVAMALPPVRWVLEKTVLPKPGEGPSPKEQLEGKFDLVFLGTTPSGETIRTRVTGDRDPGYGSTAKMLSQAAACLAKDVPEDAPGGFWTPATLLGDKLIDRLTADAGLTFELQNA